jgi:CDGSH-type Zn-finger protein
VKITLIPNGPVMINTQGEWRYTGAGKSHKNNDRVALCRCGQSANKPFCDGTHKKVGFEAAGGDLELTPK